MKFEILKELFTNFITSSFVTKFLLFLSAFFAPVWELYFLLLFLVVVDYIIDFINWYRFDKKVEKSWTVTQPFVTKVIMYSVLAITVNAVQQHLIKETFDFFKLVIAIPIVAELIGILGSVEKTTGVAIVDKVKEYIKNWIISKGG